MSFERVRLTCDVPDFDMKVPSAAVVFAASLETYWRTLTAFAALGQQMIAFVASDYDGKNSSRDFPGLRHW